MMWWKEQCKLVRREEYQWEKSRQKVGLCWISFIAGVKCYCQGSLRGYSWEQETKKEGNATGYLREFWKYKNLLIFWQLICVWVLYTQIYWRLPWFSYDLDYTTVELLFSFANMQASPLYMLDLRRKRRHG